jgi:hypothetical protein
LARAGSAGDRDGDGGGGVSDLAGGTGSFLTYDD